MLRVKIVCTIGPSSTDPDILAQLIDAGMNVARINMSHGDHNFHARNIHAIREIAQERNRPIAILVDLQGPKLRVGEMQPGGVPLTAGEELILTTEDIIGVPGRVPIQNKEVPSSIEQGRLDARAQAAAESNERILLDDGLLELEVLDATESTVRTRVIVGGTLEDRKGMNLPQTRLTVPSMTEKDRVDVDFALEHQADWIALSFVRTAADIHALRKVVQNRTPLGRATPIISKIEKPEAVENIEEIIQASDGLMVARGDLGIETSPEAVPMIQKMIIARCIGTDKPVITATQMLESMIRNPRPTRAEASDVANAVLDGSDAIMLSGETAAGVYPVESVRTMANIAQEAERVRAVTQPHYRPSQQAVDGFFGTSASGSGQGNDSHSRAAPSVAEAVSQATVNTARNVGAAAIIAPTARGATAKKLARFRPSVPIIAVTPSHLVYRQLALYWGVFPLMGQRMNTIDEMLEDAVRIALRAGFVQQGDVTVVTGGVVGGVPGETNLMTVRRIARVLMHGQGVGNRRMSGRVVRLKPGQDPQAQEIQRRMMTTQDILVAEELNQVSMELVYHAGGLITAESAPDSIAALAAVELGIPAILQATGEWDELIDGQTIVIDARTGNVYEWDL